MVFPRILLVEDHEPVRRFISAMLQSADFHVFHAADGLEAVEKALELQPDLILLDIGLPKLNGIEAAKRIRTLAPWARVLFVSQESASLIVQETFQVGGCGYVHKPLVWSDLVPAVKAALNDKRFVSSGLDPGPDFNEAPTIQHRHEVQFYSDDSTFIKRTTPFLASSMRTADAVLVLATKSHQESFVHELAALGFDLDLAIKQGTYISLDATETLSAIMTNRNPDENRFAAGLSEAIESAGKAVGAEKPRVAIFGECVGLLLADGNPEAAIRLEKLGNDLIKRHHAHILCGYPFMTPRNDDVFNSICAEHTAAYWS